MKDFYALVKSAKHPAEVEPGDDDDVELILSSSGELTCVLVNN